MKAFLYSRVSTEEQNPGMQILELEEYCRRRGWQKAEGFCDVTSGARDRRPRLDDMLRQVRRRECDVVIVWKFDRFARSTRFLLNTLEEFDELGVRFVSLHDQLDTTTAAGRLMFTVIAAVAEFERDLLRERTRAGVAHARAQGKRIGRPRAEPDLSKITALRALGRPWSEVSEALGGVGESTLRRYAQKAGKQ